MNRAFYEQQDYASGTPTADTAAMLKLQPRNAVPRGGSMPAALWRLWLYLGVPNLSLYDARIQTIYGGSSEIMRELGARSIAGALATMGVPAPDTLCAHDRPGHSRIFSFTDTEKRAPSRIAIHDTTTVKTTCKKQSKRIPSLMAWLLCLALSPWMAISSRADDTALEGVIDRHWQWVLEQYPERRLEYRPIGERDGRIGASRHLASLEDEGRFVSELERIEPATLSADGRVNWAMLFVSRDNRSEFEDGLHLIALDMRSGPQHWHSMVEYLPMETEQDLLDWLTRLRALPDQLAQCHTLLSEGLDKGRTQAQIVMSRVPAQIRTLLDGDASDSPFSGRFLSTWRCRNKMHFLPKPAG